MCLTALALLPPHPPAPPQVLDLRFPGVQDGVLCCCAAMSCALASQSTTNYAFVAVSGWCCVLLACVATWLAMPRAMHRHYYTQQLRCCGQWRLMAGVPAGVGQEGGTMTINTLSWGVGREDMWPV